MPPSSGLGSGDWQPQPIFEQALQPRWLSLVQVQPREGPDMPGLWFRRFTKALLR